MKKRKRVRRDAPPHAVKDSTGGAEIEVVIERIVPGGMGLAHAAGRTIFVALAAPGDRVRVRIEKTRGNVAFASIVKVIAASPVRIEPPCPYFGRCGGCDFQQLNYEAQLAAKVAIIQDCLRRIARLETPLEIPIIASPSAWRYRSRAQWQHDGREKTLGYFTRGSHRVCDVIECPVIVPALQRTLTDLRAALSNDSLPEGVEEFQAVAGDAGVSLVPHVSASAAETEVSFTIAGFHYHFDAAGFFQINHQLLAPLVEAAIANAKGATAIDLYCGAGLFTLPLARRFERVVGVEANETAVAYAQRNVQEAALANARVECAKVGEWLKRNAEKYAPVDLVLLNPPRAGVEDVDALNGILSLQPQRIRYVSCDPATLARDLRGLISSGYSLDSVAAFDMFPQTHHVEIIAQLSSPARLVRIR
ncbi:MAG: class I SAM-dependent RNA methyltransferase [Pyrinomonadaceae bacterium]